MMAHMILGILFGMGLVLVALLLVLPRAKPAGIVLAVAGVAQLLLSGCLMLGPGGDEDATFDQIMAQMLGASIGDAIIFVLIAVGLGLIGFSQRGTVKLC